MVSAQDDTPQVELSDLSGQGTDLAPYQISSPAHLRAINEDLDAHYKITRDIDVSGTSSWNDGKGLAPIGNASGNGGAFNGTLMGDGNKLTGLYIERNQENGVGMFHEIGEEGVVKNLEIKDLDVSGNSTVGGLAGTNLGTIKQTSVDGKVNGTSHVGGMVGKTGTINGDRKAVINRSTTSVDVAGHGEQIGGLAGTAGNGSVVTSTKADNQVSRSNPDKTHGNSKDMQVGGLIGLNQGEVVYVKARGQTEANVNRVGGLTGENRGRITKSSYKGRVSGKRMVGGLVGINRGAVKKSHASPQVRVEGRDIGGLVGVNNGGTVAASYALGAARGNGNVGGFIGLNKNLGSVSNSYARVQVSGGGRVGGFVANNKGDGRVVNGYFDLTTSRRKGSGPGKSLVVAERNLNVRKDLAGFDFETTWLDQGTGYPTLGLSTDFSMENRRVLTDEPVRFEAPTSLPGKPPVQYYRWRFGDSGITSGKKASHTFKKPGKYKVKLEIKRKGANIMSRRKVLEVLEYNGSGTADSPYRVKNADQLQAMEQKPEANYVLTDDINGSVAKDWSNGNGFRSIGTEDKPFRGVLDGNNKTIDGIEIHDPAADGVGLFGVAENAEVSNLTITDLSVTGGDQVGGLVGVTEGSRVESVSVEGSVAGNRSVGGAVGVNSGEVSVTRSLANVTGNSSVGGLSGVSDSGDLSESFAAGMVNGNRQVGGLVARKIGEGSAENSYWDLNVTGQNSSAAGEGLTTEQMTGSSAKDNMKGFSWGTSWAVGSTGYPVPAVLTEGGAQPRMSPGEERKNVTDMRNESMDKDGMDQAEAGEEGSETDVSEEDKKQDESTATEDEETQMNGSEKKSQDSGTQDGESKGEGQPGFGVAGVVMALMALALVIRGR
ncbi:MAG: PKD domain-containing protein [Halobacteria archaeon]